MVAHAGSKTGTAEMEGKLWSMEARNWAEAQEGQVNPLYEAVIRKLNISSGVALLDVGCGAGGFARLAAERDAQITGLDASPASLEIAKERVPEGDFRQGEMEELPFGDNTFDVVTGFNSFQYAGDPVNALREAKRVAKQGAPIVIAIWGKAEDCEAAAYLMALGPLMPPHPPDAPGPFALSEDGALEALVMEAGLTPVSREAVDCAWEYPNLDTALKGLLSSGPVIVAKQVSGEERVRETTTNVLAPFKTASGSYRLENKFIYVVARA